MFEFEVNQNSGEDGVADEVLMPFPASYYVIKPYEQCKIKNCKWYHFDAASNQCLHMLPSAEVCQGTGGVDTCVATTTEIGPEMYETRFKTDAIVPRLDICMCCSVGTDYNGYFNNTQCAGPISYEVKTDVIVPGMVAGFKWPDFLCGT